MLEIGTAAPDFELPDKDGKMRKLSEFRGRKVVLYFYPKDNTSGCTKQACGFAEKYPQFREAGAEVIGVSRDKAESHIKFSDKYSLPFVLLTDADHAVTELYGAWQEKNNYGKKTTGVVRTTYLIDENGMIIRAKTKVKAADDPADELEALTK